MSKMHNRNYLRRKTQRRYMIGGAQILKCDPNNAGLHRARYRRGLFSQGREIFEEKKQTTCIKVTFSDFF